MLTPIDAGRRSAMADNCSLVQMALPHRRDYTVYSNASLNGYRQQ